MSAVGTWQTCSAMRGEKLNNLLPISVVILCHDEVENLPRCLTALRSCDEVVVVDDGSTDGSQAVAEAAGARVLTHPFESFADQRNWAMRAGGLRNGWILHLDADEVMTDSALEEIGRRLPAMPADAVGWLARKVMLGEKWLRFSADYPVFVPRLIHRQGLSYVMRGHGDVLPAEPAASVYFESPMLHYNFSKGWTDWRARHERYATAEAARIHARAVIVSMRSLWSDDPVRRRAALRALSYRLPGRPVLRFIYAWIFRFGFLDGVAGLRFCMAMASYERMIDRHVRSIKKGG